MRTNIYHILFTISILAFYLPKVNAQTNPIPKTEVAIDSTVTTNQPIENDSVKKVDKGVIEAIIDHNAVGYIDQNVATKKITLFDQAEINYQNINIRAGKITIDYNTNLVLAKGIYDSIGTYSQLPVFTQGPEESTQDSIVFNFKTEKAIIYGLKTEQNGIITLGEKTKKVNDSTIFIRNIRFTTSNKKNPDYYLKTKKAKVVPNKKIIVGATNLVVADVPTPILLPFAYLPLTTTKTSGLIVPTYGESNNQGFFLQNGGYYFAGNDYYDLTLLGDIYSNSSWGVRVESSYKKRYGFSGRLRFNYENLIYGLKGFDDFSKSKNFNFSWSHSQDAKASPNSRLSASVNLGSSRYYRESLNLLNNSQALTNILNSSISYYQKFVGTPFNMSVSASHSQNTNTEIVTMTLPSLQFNMDRIFPFAPKSGSKKDAFQKIGITYALRGDNRITAQEDEFFSSKMFDNAQNGLQHDIKLSTNVKLLKYFTLSPSASYKEVWYFKTIEKDYNSSQQAVVTDTINGFKSFREYSASVAISTNIYGMYKFKGKNLQAIRHTIRPSVSLGYKPDFSFYNRDFQQSADVTDIGQYSIFDGGIYGTPSTGLSNTVGISIANNLEAKVRDKDENAKEEFKKITLLNNLMISTSYNAAADSLRWNQITVSAGTQLFKNKLSINMRAGLDPYALNANGQRFNKLNINNNGSLFRLTGANLTMSYSLSSEDFKKDSNSSNKNERVANAQNNDMFGKNLTDNFTNTQPEPIEDDENKDENTVKLYHNSMPWNINLSYASTYINSSRQDQISNNSLMVSGDIELTPKWRLGASTGYDFKNQGFTYTQFRFSRDLDSWRLNFNWVPFGTRKSYYFFIGVKSPFLSDLKWEKRNVPDRRLF